VICPNFNLRSIAKPQSKDI